MSDKRLDLILNELQTIKTDIKDIKKEQNRHGELIHKIIQIVGSLGNEVKSNHEQVTNQLSELKSDAEFIYDKASRNELELHRLKKTN